MGRMRSAARGKVTEAAPPPLAIEPNTLFTATALRQALGLKPSSLRRAIREYALVASKRCGKYFFLGADILDWLRRGRLGAAEEK